MSITELIQHLEQLREKHGDCQVFDFMGDERELTTMMISHGYAITVHKSQGSEYKYVIIYIPNNPHTSFLNINLLYTAITRTKHTCWLIASEAMISSIAACKLSHRFDNLLTRIVQLNKDVTIFAPVQKNIEEDDNYNPFEEEDVVYPDD